MDTAIEPRTTALVVIDLQKGLATQPAAPHAMADVRARVVDLAETVRSAGGLVVLVRVTPSPDGRDALRPMSDAPIPGGDRPRDWADLLPELQPGPSDLTITKRQWGAFYGTELDLQLRRRGIRTVLLCGRSTNLGVESTARAAYELGYEQVFVEDAMTALTAVEHTHTVRTIFPRIGRVRSTQDVLDALPRTSGRAAGEPRS